MNDLKSTAPLRRDRRIDWEHCYPDSLRDDQGRRARAAPVDDGELAVRVARLERVVDKIAEFIVGRLGEPE